MDITWLFETDDYRAVLKRKLSQEGSTRGYRTSLAKAAGCQLAYISHVLAGHAEFTPDQAAGLCDFWNFDELQSEYFLTLTHIARAGSPRLLARLHKRLNDLRRENRKTQGSRLSHETYDPERVVEYYLDWAVCGVHACLMVPGLNDTKKICERLGLEEPRINQALRLLQDLGFAVREGASWKATTRFFHASDENKFARLHHRNWREQSVEAMNRVPTPKENLHYTAIHSLSREDLNKIRALIKDLITQSHTLVRASGEETLACVAIDWFEL